MTDVKTKLNLKHSPVYKQWTKEQTVICLIKHDNHSCSAVIELENGKYAHYFFFFVGTSWQISADVAGSSAHSVFKSIAKRSESL